VGTYARETCGFDPATLDNPEGSEAPEPPDACGLLDLEPVAAAAGVELDATDGDGTGTYNGGDFASNSCSYGNGAATVSTNTFASSDVAEQRQLYVDLAEGNNGSVLDADLGDLPDTTVVTEVSGFTQITVFEATPSFSLAFTGVSDPDALVAAAEVALAQLG
jgi:hypothetical protein